MNRSDYKRLGDYIREVDVRNRDLAVTNLLGLSMTKQFRPSTSNIVGVDLSKYKVVNNNVFAFDPMSVIRVHKVPIALNETDSPIIVSPAYITFESIDEDLLNPQYLMMWFRRAEFDRYADFKSDSSVRGGYNWDELCETMVCIPSIERQRAMVAEYETLSQRIGLNRSIIAQLEATAQTLYRKMFVDNIDPEHLPAGWRMGTLGEIADFKNGKAVQKGLGNIPIYGGNGIVGYCSASNAKNVVIIGRVGINCGSIFLETKNCWVNDNAIIGIAHSDLSYYLYQTINRMDLNSQSEGSGQPLLTQAILNNQECVISPQDIAVAFNTRIECVYKYLETLNEEQSILTELQSLLLAKMGL